MLISGPFHSASTETCGRYKLCSHNDLQCFCSITQHEIFTALSLCLSLALVLIDLLKRPLNCSWNANSEIYIICSNTLFTPGHPAGLFTLIHVYLYELAKTWVGFQNAESSWVVMRLLRCPQWLLWSW